MNKKVITAINSFILYFFGIFIIILSIIYIAHEKDIFTSICGCLLGIALCFEYITFVIAEEIFITQVLLQTASLCIGIPIYIFYGTVGVDYDNFIVLIKIVLCLIMLRFLYIVVPYYLKNYRNNNW